MSDTVISAPRNPYRVDAARDGMQLEWQGLAGGTPALPPRHDTTRGPGMTAADIDRMCRDHFAMGHATRDRAAQDELGEMRGRLADAYDAGYTAGRVERAQGLAREVFSRLMEPQVKIIEARGGPKMKAHAALDGIEEALVEVREFVAGLFSPHDATAGDRAAAQVARDE